MTETKKTTKTTKKVAPQTIDRLSGNEVFKYTDKNGYEYWLNFQYIKDYIYVDNLLKIFFVSDKSLFINCSWTIFNNQMLKCSRLYVVYSMR